MVESREAAEDQEPLINLKFSPVPVPFTCVCQRESMCVCLFKKEKRVGECVCLSEYVCQSKNVGDCVHVCV